MPETVEAKLTALIITLNEQADLEDCLKSVSFCDEVIVVDSGSTDQTLDIACSHGARVISTSDWPGFGAQKQRALDAANSDWVLSLDADERISPKLKTEIISVIHNPNESGTNGFLINRKNFFLGRALKHGGWSPDYVLRLARRDKCKFDLAIVHERLLVNGTVKHLKESMIHLSYKTQDEILLKRLKYSRAGAVKLHANGRKCSGPAESVFRGTWTFIRHCFLQLGFLDGWLGLYAAYCKAKENQLKYRLLWALTRDGQSVK